MTLAVSAHISQAVFASSVPSQVGYIVALGEPGCSTSTAYYSRASPQTSPKQYCSRGRRLHGLASCVRWAHLQAQDGYSVVDPRPCRRTSTSGIAIGLDTPQAHSHAEATPRLNCLSCHLDRKRRLSRLRSPNSIVGGISPFPPSSSSSSSPSSSSSSTATRKAGDGL